MSWAGYDTAAVVPAFLTAAFHVTVDVPAAVTAARDASGLRLVVAEPIGPDLSLLEAARRLAARRSGRAGLCGHARRDGAGEPGRPGPGVVRPTGFAGGGRLRVGGRADHRGRARGSRGRRHRASIASFTLLPGVLPDRISEAAGGRACTEPLGIALPAETARIVLARADAA
ncbi:MAG: CbiX/SirB N-terminal domain-containing protein [Candidatus Nanopelagicales bacterium]